MDSRELEMYFKAILTDLEQIKEELGIQIEEQDETKTSFRQKGE